MILSYNWNNYKFNVLERLVESSFHRSHGSNHFSDSLFGVVGVGSCSAAAGSFVRATESPAAGPDLEVGRKDLPCVEMTLPGVQGPTASSRRPCCRLDCRDIQKSSRSHFFKEGTIKRIFSKNKYFSREPLARNISIVAYQLTR